MKIECLIKRDGPTHVTIAGFDYVFAPDENGRKVCDVLSTDHQAHFLALKDYVPYEPDNEEQKQEQGPENAAQEDTEEIEEETEVEAEDKVEVEEEVKEEKLLYTSDGTPYSSKSSALRFSSSHGYEPDEVEPVEVEGGYALRVIKKEEE